MMSLSSNMRPMPDRHQEMNVAYDMAPAESSPKVSEKPPAQGKDVPSRTIDG
jgi:hypothetical protein